MAFERNNGGAASWASEQSCRENRRRLLRHAALLGRRRQAKGIEPAIGADKEMPVGGDQRLEMAQAGDERRAGEQYLAGIAAKAVQPVVALGAEDPDDRIGGAVGR